MRRRRRRCGREDEHGEQVDDEDWLSRLLLLCLGIVSAGASEAHDVSG